jgi:hypothetical protein
MAPLWREERWRAGTAIAIPIESAPLPLLSGSAEPWVKLRSRVQFATARLFASIDEMDSSTGSIGIDVPESVLG